MTNGFLVGYNPVANVVRFYPPYPPLTIDEADIVGLLESLEENIRDSTLFLIKERPDV